TPAGIRCSTVRSWPTRSVWPALLPPPKRTMMSASRARMSTILPLPSSPHCTPTTIVVLIVASEAEQLRRDDVGRLAQLLQHGLGQGMIDVEERDGAPAPLLTAELQAGDVDAARAEERADPADDTWHVPIVQHQNVPLRHRLEVEAVEAHQAQD